MRIGCSRSGQPLEGERAGDRWGQAEQGGFARPHRGLQQLRCLPLGVRRGTESRRLAVPATCGRRDFDAGDSQNAVGRRLERNVYLRFTFDLTGLLLRRLDLDTFLDLGDGACQEGRSQNVPASDGVHVAAEDLMGGEGGESGWWLPENGRHKRIAVYGNRPTVSRRGGRLDRFSIHPNRRRPARCVQVNGIGRRPARPGIGRNWKYARSSSAKPSATYTSSTGSENHAGGRWPAGSRQ